MEKQESINFFSDQYLLHGVLHLPDTPNPPVVIGCHGLLANSNSPKQIALARRCCEAGIAYFRFDHRGCGLSQGDFEKVTSLPARCNDLRSAIKTVRNIVGRHYPIGLFGSSMGGAVCLAVAAATETGPKVVVAAPLSTRALNRPPRPKEDGFMHISDSFYVDNLSFDLQDSLSKINNILIFHGDMDVVVPVANAYQLYTLADQPKKMVIQENGDHSMSGLTHQQEFQTEALDWFRRGFRKEV